MYVPEHFKMSPTDLESFLSGVHGGNLVTLDPKTSRITASFLPWVLVDGQRLTTHMGRVNPQSVHQGDALVIFMGNDGYISEEWLGDGSSPTWNYETVHVYGQMTTHTDPQWIYQSWRDLLDHSSASRLEDYDPGWLEKQVPATVGVEVEITEVMAKSKLLQNRREEVVRTVATNLEDACPALAERILTVCLPYIAARQERVRAARPYRFDESSGSS